MNRATTGLARVHDAAVNIEIRSPEKKGHRAFFEALGPAFGGWNITDEELEHASTYTDLTRAHAAFDGDDMVGVTGAFAFSLSVPGAEIPAAGVTMTGVLPTHRRRGVLTALMRRQLADVHAWGEPVAVLWASEGNIYERYGYGLASTHLAIDVEWGRARLKARHAPEGRTRLLSEEDALKVMPDIYDRVFPSVPGLFRRSPEWWRHHTFPDYRDDNKERPLFFAVAEIGGRPEGYAIYRMHPEWDHDGLPVGWLQIFEEMSATPAATAQIWSYLFGIDLVARVKYQNLAGDHPLPHMVPEVRRLRMDVKDGIHARIVDVERALAGRSYAVDDRISFELTDETLEWNQGTWELDTTGDDARVARTDRPADLRLTTADLGATFLGGVTFSQLTRAGRIVETTSDAAWRADIMFRSQRAPYCAEDF